MRYRSDGSGGLVAAGDAEVRRGIGRELEERRIQGGCGSMLDGELYATVAAPHEEIAVAPGL
jgi:hypothetical protein